MKKTKKGFTIVELVIVIAVIAILAAVLIPNLSRLVNKANESKAMQEAKNAYEAYLITDVTDEENGKKSTPAENMGSINLCIESDGHYYHVTNGSFSAEEVKSHGTCSLANATNMTVKNGVLETVTEESTSATTEP